MAGIEADELEEYVSEPVIVAVAAFTFIGVWNDSLGPLAPRRYSPLPLRHSAFSIQHSPRWGPQSKTQNQKSKIACPPADVRRGCLAEG
jgi:hypothetical protein